MNLEQRLKELRVEVEGKLSKYRLDWLCRKRGIVFKNAGLFELQWLLSEAEIWRKHNENCE